VQPLDQRGPVLPGHQGAEVVSRGIDEFDGGAGDGNPRSSTTVRWTIRSGFRCTMTSSEAGKRIVCRSFPYPAP